MGARKRELELLYDLGRFEEVVKAPTFDGPFDDEQLFSNFPNSLSKEIRELCLKGLAASNGHLRFIRCCAFYHIGRLEESEQELILAYRHDPSNLRLYTWRAIIRYAQGRYSDAKEEYERGLAANIKGGTKDDVLVNNFASLLAACPDDDVRDGARALEMSLQARNAKARISSDTLACAYAEVGRFEEAITHQRKHLEECMPERLNRAQEVLSCFLEGKPYRTPPGFLEISRWRT